MVAIAYLDSSLRPTFYHKSHYVVEDDVALFTGISLLVGIRIMSICSKPTTLLVPINSCSNVLYIWLYITHCLKVVTWMMDCITLIAATPVMYI